MEFFTTLCGYCVRKASIAAALALGSVWVVAFWYALNSAGSLMVIG